MSPSLSVIVPVHNSAPFVRKTVESIVNQTYEGEMEILLVENGSTDNSLEVIKQISDEYPDVKILVSPKTGPSEARNFALERSKGQLIAFADSDDYLEPDMYKALIDAKNKYGAETAYCNFKAVYEDGKSFYLGQNTGNIEVKDGPTCAYDIIMEIGTSAPWNRVFDRDFFKSRRFPEGMVYEDHNSLYKWMNDCKKAVFVDRPLYNYCIRSSGITSSTDKYANKIIDRFNADYNRLEFIKKNNYYSYSQKKNLVRHVIKELYIHYKMYLNLQNRENLPKKDPGAAAIYKKFMSALHYFPLPLVGLKLYSKGFKVTGKRISRLLS